MSMMHQRNEIKRLLPKLTEHERIIFMRLYSPFDLKKDIIKVVDDMPSKNVDWALTQVQNSYTRIFRILKTA